MYQVSNFGRVKSFHPRNKIQYGVDERLLKPWIVEITPRYKRELVGLSKDKKTKTFKVHRLVAQAFIPNPENLPQVNHKDFNPLNNYVDNLEWCTNSYNKEYSYKAGRCYKIPVEIRSEIAIKYLDGVSIADLMKEYGYPYYTIANILKENSIYIPHRDRGKYGLDLDELLEEMKVEKSNKFLAEKHNCSKDIIATRRYLFRKRGLL